MTDKTMTLEQVRDEMIQQVAASDYPTMGQVSEWMNAITRHLSQPAERGDSQGEAEPVGEAYTMQTSKRHTMAVFDCLEVPAGTKLYTAPPPAAGVPDELVRKTIRALDDVDTEMRATGRATNRFSRLASDWRGMLSATPSPATDIAAVRGAVKAVPWTSDPTVVCLSLDDGTQCNVYPESRVNETDVDEQQYFLEALARSIGDAK